ncbi:MAG: hypothetical protein IJC26_04325 [Clostridia bacterium]|nr:hypothetical protein [Clostridia bacterium]
MNRDEMPVGFSMALAMNPEAMRKFAMLTGEQKQEIIQGTHRVKSREEMQRYVDSLANGKQ